VTLYSFNAMYIYLHLLGQDTLDPPMAVPERAYNIEGLPYNVQRDEGTTFKSTTTLRAKLSLIILTSFARSKTARTLL
jgi:hypothetical protein